MSSLADLLTQQRPDIQTRKALLVLDLQNDFTQDGRLPVTYPSGLANLTSLCNAFREDGNHVVWLRTEYSQLLQYDSTAETAGGDAVVSSTHNHDAGLDGENGDDSEEEMLRALPPSRSAALLKRVAAKTKASRSSSPSSTAVPRDLFLSQPSQNSMQRCCQHGSRGADFTATVAQLIDAKHDMVIFKNTYSAFSSSNLLFQLRARLVTEIFICGSLTNVSVYATTATAVQHGLEVTILEDCLGYVDLRAHEEALRRMRDDMGVTVTTSTTLVPASRRATLKSKRSINLTLPMSRVTMNSTPDSPTESTSSLSSMTTRSRLPQKSPDGARSPGESPLTSPTGGRKPLVRGESASSLTSDTSQLERRISSLALRQKPSTSHLTPAKWQEVVLKRAASQQFRPESAVSSDNDGADLKRPLAAEPESEKSSSANVSSVTEQEADKTSREEGHSRQARCPTTLNIVK